MRRIDYWLGLPLCFLLSGVNHILRFIAFRKKENATAAKILFIKLSEIGSIILAHSLINKTQKEFPQSGLFFLTFKNNQPLFELSDLVPCSNVLTVRKDSVLAFILDTLRAIKSIRKEKIGIVLDLEFFSRFSAILTYLSGAPKRIGFYRYSLEGLYRGNFLTHKVQYNPLLHISKSYLSLAEAINQNRKDSPELFEEIGNKTIVLPEFVPSQENKRQLRDKLRSLGVDDTFRLLLVNPGGGDIPLREWPLDNFVNLAKRLLENSKNYIIVVGAGDAQKKSALFLRSVNHKRCLDFSNKTTLVELLTLFYISEALIANDCGLAHLASLTPLKKFVLFGPENPQLYRPLGDKTWIIYSDSACSPCLSAFNHRVSACRDNICLKRIKPEAVYEIIKKEIY